MLSLLLLFVLGCAHGDHRPDRSSPVETETGREYPRLSLPPALEERVLGLDPDSITDRDVREVLSQCPAPRILTLNGSIPLITMDSFSKFLISMGYPEESLRNPRDGSYSYSSYQSSKRLAGVIAWYYEKEGMMPMVIGHSQGGMLTVKILHEFAGAFNNNIPVWNPSSEEPEDRYTIRDPLTGIERNVVGLRMGYASAIATGNFMRVILGQWEMLARLRKIPDTVEEFTGFHIPYDLLGGNLFGVGKRSRYYPLGSAAVRNVTLPAGCSHITVPLTEDLATDSESRQWIQGYSTSTEDPELPALFQGKANNIIFAADIWYSIKKHWCIELQRTILAQRNTAMVSRAYAR